MKYICLGYCDEKKWETMSESEQTAMKEYLLLFDGKARELAVTSQDEKAIAAQLLNILPKRSMAEWMVEFNVKSRYLGKK